MDHGEGHRRSSLLTKLGLAFLTGTSALAVYRSEGDPAAVAFVALAYAALLLLLHSLRRFERARPEDRGGAKAAVWVLTTLLTGMFAARVAPMVPPLVGGVVWVVAAATVGGGFWALFVE